MAAKKKTKKAKKKKSQAPRKVISKNVKLPSEGRKSALDIIALILVIVGGLNWGLVGLCDLDLVNFILGASVAADIVYILVGLAAIYTIYYAFKK